MGQDSVANELVNCGANINQPNCNGDTPLHLAAASSSGMLCLELLINNGADVNIEVKCVSFIGSKQEQISKKMYSHLFSCMFLPE